MTTTLATYLIVILFCLTLAIVYTYLLYPTTLRIYSRLRRYRGRLVDRNRQSASMKNSDRQDEESVAISANLPLFTLILPMHNEASTVKQKIKNTMALVYDVSKLEVIVVTDGSTDATPAILRTLMRDYHEQFSVLELPSNEGKYRAISRAVDIAKGSVIGVTDASARLDKYALVKMVEVYRDPNVGAASSHYRVPQSQSNEQAIGQAERRYFEYENELKRLEDQCGSLSVVQGAFYSFRRELFRPVSKLVINDDLYIPCQVMRQGYRVAYASLALVDETQRTEQNKEFHKRTRIAIGNLQCLTDHWILLNPFLYGDVSFKLLVHKVSRLLSPFLLITLLVVHVMLAYELPSFVTVSSLALHVLFYFSALVGLLINRYYRSAWAIFHLPYYFVLTNVAVANGVLRYLWQDAGEVRWSHSLSIKQPRR